MKETYWYAIVLSMLFFTAILALVIWFSPKHELIVIDQNRVYSIEKPIKSEAPQENKVVQNL